VAELAAAARRIVTADCGSTSHAARTLARELGVDLIITDHPVPDAAARCLRPGSIPAPRFGYPCDYLCGAGVAFKLMQALADALCQRVAPPWSAARSGWPWRLSPTSCVARGKPPPGCCRPAHHECFPRPGVRALIETSGLKPGEVDAAALAFRVAPRVECRRRLDDPEPRLNRLL